MWRQLVIVLIPLFALPSYSLHESEVGVIDWHKSFIGIPLLDAPTGPDFHSIPGTDNEFILTATRNNVLAALNSSDGSVAWRSIHDPDDIICGVYKHSNVVATLSGPGGSTLRTYDAISGHLNLEKRLHDPASGHSFERPHIGASLVFGENSTVFILTNGHTVTKIDLLTKDIVWTWSAPDQTSLTIYTHIVSTPDAVFVIGLSKSFVSNTLQLASFDPTSGTLLADRSVSSKINSFESYVLLSVPLSLNPSTGLNSNVPHVLWLDGGRLFFYALNHSLDVASPTLLKIESRTSVVRFAHLGSPSGWYVVAVDENGAEHLVGLEGAGVKRLLNFVPGSEGKGSLTNVVHGGTEDMFVVQVLPPHGQQSMKLQSFKLNEQEVVVDNLNIFVPFDDSKHGNITLVKLSFHTDTISYTPALILLTTNVGTIQMWKSGHNGVLTEVWTREESLANAPVAKFVELPPKLGSHKQIGKLSGDAFSDRLQRQMWDLKNSPRSFFASYLSSGHILPFSLSVEEPNTDLFGFRQIIVVATSHRKLFGIDSASGRILWSRIFGLGSGEEISGTVRPVKIYGGFSKESSVGKGGGTEVVVVTQIEANSLVDTVVFHVDALSGVEVKGKRTRSPGEGVLEGTKVIGGVLVDSFVVDPPSTVVEHPTPTPGSQKHLQPGRSILLFDKFLQVYLYPEMPHTQATIDTYAPMIHFPLRMAVDDGVHVHGEPDAQQRVVGHGIGLKNKSSEKYTACPLWTFSIDAEETVQAVVPAHRREKWGREAASWGKVLGNRTTLYKYLNPRTVIVLTEPRRKESRKANAKDRCGLYVLDAAKGTAVYGASIPTNDGKCDLKVSLVENWLVYHYYDGGFGRDSLDGEAKGWRIVSVELYEGGGVDDKKSSSDMSSYKNESINVLALEQSYVFPHRITSIAPTSTKFGITNKDLIVATENGQVQSIKRMLLNPRRPNRTTTVEEQEEFLIRYEPLVGYDPKQVLSHRHEVANVHTILTAPALLESTSLVFVLGLDMFLTRVTPSGAFDMLSEGFNKTQLLVTIFGLGLAIVVIRPMVKRKALKQKWYN